MFSLLICKSFWINNFYKFSASVRSVYVIYAAKIYITSYIINCWHVGFRHSGSELLLISFEEIFLRSWFTNQYIFSLKEFKFSSPFNYILYMVDWSKILCWVEFECHFPSFPLFSSKYIISFLVSIKRHSLYTSI